MNRFVLASSVLAAVALAMPAHSAPPACNKWWNNLQFCEVFGPCPSPPDYQPAFAQQRWYNSVRWGDSAEDVCQSALLYTKPYAGYAGDVVAGPESNNGAWCYTQQQNSNGTYGAFTVPWIYVTVWENIQVESCCYQTPDGPYKDVPDNNWGAMTSNNEFTPTQKDKIRNWNAIANEGEYRSDIGTSGPGPLRGAPPWPSNVQNDYYNVLNHDPQTLMRLDDGSPLGNIFAPMWSAMQVDHIIPRVDINGCRCGPNTKANALLISAKLNNKMSNNCQDPTRKAILDRWSFGPN